jgi:LmbE family N-acetylglucosaminyl deacetylase
MQTTATNSDRTASGAARGADVHFDVGALGRVLGIWAHPDDETYLAGGLMAMAARNGQATMCITATSGEHGTPDPSRWPPARLARRRRRELRQALHVLGVRHHVVLDNTDGALADADAVRAIDDLVEHIERFRPDTVVTFGPDGFTGHFDHQVVGDWATTASRLAGAPRVLHAAKDNSWTERFQPAHQRFPIFYPGYPQPVATSDIVVDLTLDDDAFDQKTRALLAHRTQTDAIIAALGCSEWREWFRRESFTEPSDRTVELVSSSMGGCR